MEENYKELVRFDGEKRIVVAHVYSTGRIVFLENIAKTFADMLPPHKGRVQWSTSVSPLIGDTYYLLGITFYIKETKIFIKCMEEKDRDEIITDWVNRSTRQIADNHGYIAMVGREADLSKLSFLRSER